jgi:RHS repeat-associated protein
MRLRRGRVLSPRPGFTGKERDGETGLDYFLARYYSGAQGRFTSPDPKLLPDAVFDPQSLNKYSYTRNNPIRLVDPNGEDWMDVVNGVANAVKSNFTQGIGRETGNGDFRLGQRIGDGLSMVMGTAEMLAGGAKTAGGAALCGTGAGCMVGAPAIVGGTAIAAHGAGMAGTALANFMKSDSPDPQFEPYSPDRKLPTTRGGKPIPEANPDGSPAAAHTQLGKKQSRNAEVGKYTKGREFDAQGNHVRDVDFTNHGRGDHPNPHQHRIDPATGKRGRPEEVK